MVRQFEAVKMAMDDLTFLYPREILSRLESIARDIGVDPVTAPTKAVPADQTLDALDSLVNGFFLPTLERREPLGPEYARLTKKLQQHLAYLIAESMIQAHLLESSQPDTPLGFPKGQLGVLSNLLSASWIDLTCGGQVDVKWTQLD